MKILNLKAEHFMKFAKIELNNFPKKGLLGIFGENESGKSTLGDAIFFSLYGLTSKCSSQNISTLIKWGETFCKTQVDFIIPADEKNKKEKLYILTRQISSNNEQKAHLILNDDVIANGWNEVNKTVCQILGFSHNDFRFTSFMAQKEIDLIYKSIQQSEKVINSLLKTDLINNALHTLENQEIEFKKNLSVKMDKKSKLNSELDEIKELLKEADNIQTKIVNLENNIQGVDKEITLLSSCLSIENKNLTLFKNLSENSSKKSSLIPKFEELENKSTTLVNGINRSFTKTFGIDSNDIPQELVIKSKELILKDVTSIGALKEHLRKIEQARTQIVEKEALINLRDVKNESLEFVDNQIKHKKDINTKIVKIDSELAELEKEKEDACKNTISLIKNNLILEKELENKKDLIKKSILRVKESLLSIHKKMNNQISALKNDNLSDSIEKNEEKLTSELKKVKVNIFEFGKSINRSNNLFILFIFCSLLSFMAIVAVFKNDLKQLYLLSAIPAFFLLISIFYQRKKTKLERLKNNLNQDKTEIEERIDKKTSSLKDEIEKINDKLNFINDNQDVLGLFKFSTPQDIRKTLNALKSLNTEKYKSIDSELYQNIMDFKALLNNNESGLKLDFLSYKIDQSLSWSEIIKKNEELKNKNNKKEAELIEYLNKLKQEVKSTASLSDKSGKLKSEIEDINKKIEHLEKSIKPFSKNTITEKEINTVEQIKNLENQVEFEKNELHSMEIILKELFEIKGHLKHLEEKKAEHDNQEEKIIMNIKKLMLDNPSSINYNIENYNINKMELKIEDIKSNLNKLEFKSSNMVTEAAHLRGKLKGFETLKERHADISTSINKINQLIQMDDLDLKSCPEIRKGFIKTAQNIKAGFIPEFSEYVGKIMAHLTLDRYQKIKIDKDLSIKVFSAEKNDYIPPENLSGGTSDQLMLAIRLAFANTLLQEKGKKFLFLDEHLASFDKNRRDACLDILKYLEFSFDQVILISHLSGLENYMSSHIFLNKNSDTLIIKALRP